MIFFSRVFTKVIVVIQKHFFLKKIMLFFLFHGFKNQIGPAASIVSRWQLIRSDELGRNMVELESDRVNQLAELFNHFFFGKLCFRPNWAQKLSYGLIRSQLVSQLIHVLSMVPDNGAIWYVSSWYPLIVVLKRE